MELYHGSTEVVEEPVVHFSRRYGDFGIGFYTTGNYIQASDWAKTKSDRSDSSDCFVSKYSFNVTDNMKVKRFIAPDEEWLDFVTSCRNRNDTSEYDLIAGPVADDTVYSVLQGYEAGVYTKEEALRRLKIQETYDQYVFKNQSAVDHLKFLGYDRVHNSKDIDYNKSWKGRDIDDPTK